MTELRHFLASLYDAVSEAEMQALLNGQQRLRRMVESGDFSDDLSLPVYHATDLSVTLDVGLEAKETKRGIQVFVTEPSADDQTGLGFDLEVYDFLQAGDLTANIDDRKRLGGDIDVHIPLRKSPVDSGAAVDSANVADEERTDEERTDEERTDEEQTDDERKDTKSTTDEPTKSNTKTGEKSAEDGKRDKDDERTSDENAEEKETERERKRFRRPAKFPGLSLPKGWARDRGNRGKGDDDR